MNTVNEVLEKLVNIAKQISPEFILHEDGYEDEVYQLVNLLSDNEKVKITHDNLFDGSSYVFEIDGQYLAYYGHYDSWSENTWDSPPVLVRPKEILVKTYERVNK